MKQPTPVQNRSSADDMPRGRRAMNARQTRPKIDFAKASWDNKWLILLGLSVGLVGGYAHFIQQPAMFRSSSQVQIIESSTKNLPVNGMESALPTRSLGDEALVMRSERNLVRAAELGELSSTPEFAGLSPDQIAAFLSGPTLRISPVVNSGSTTVFQVQYDSTSDATAQRVVQSVIDAYGVHLQEQYRNVGQETIDLIETARKEVLAKLTNIEKDFAEFKQSSPLIYRDGEITSVYRDNADTFLARKQSLLLRRAELTSSLTAVQKAIDKKLPLESVLMALLGSSESTQRVLEQEGSKKDPSVIKGATAVARASEKIQRLTATRQLDLQSRMMREQKLVPLEIERQQLASTVGSGHQAIKSLDDQIRIVKKSIQEMEKSEAKYRKELEEAWNEAERASKTAADAALKDAVEEKANPLSTERPEKAMENKVRLAVLATQQQLHAVEQELAVVSDAYTTEIKTAKAESQAEIRSAQFIREIERQQQLYDRVMQRLDEVSLVSGGEGLKLYPLNTPKMGYQFAPSFPKSMMMGGFLGLLCGFGLGLLREFADRSYRSASEIAEHTGLPIIGHIPFLPAAKVARGQPGEKLDRHLCTFFRSKGSKAESFRALRTAIYFSNQSGDNQVLQVTSAAPSDGKSTIAANLAIAIAQTGKRVILIDGDLRRPRVGSIFGLENEKGLAWAIQKVTEGTPPESLHGEVVNATEVENLSLICAGMRPQNPAELLTSVGFDAVLNHLRANYDTVIVDTPPMLAVSDPSNVISRVDAVLLVLRLRKNIKPSVAQATRMLETLNANVLGIIVNGVGGRSAKGYGKASYRDGYYNGRYYRDGYGYSYGYGSEEYNEYFDGERKPKPPRLAKKAT